MAAKLLTILAVYLAHEVSGHGMMLDPPGRSSLWRFNQLAPPNYQDNQVFCGGYYVQNELNGGNCGVCGDPFTDEHPQENENTGKYGLGIVVNQYQAGSVIDVGILLTANHLGTFTYSLCKLEDPNTYESGEHCFENLLFEDGSSNFTVEAEDVVVVNRIRLPDIECERCVLRWTYRTGNNWGMCHDGIWRQACGPQEHFRSCSDISIAAATPQTEPVTSPQPVTSSQPEPHQ